MTTNMRMRCVAGALIGAVLLSTVTHAQEESDQRVFGQCLLYRGADGHVWVGQPLVSLGMIGVMANPPLFRLHADLARQYTPLVNDLADPPSKPEFWFWGLPDLRSARAPLVLVHLDARFHQVERLRISDPDLEGAGQEVNEITSINLMCAEFISAPWRDNWKALGEGLQSITRLSLVAPGADKDRSLQEVIDRCAARLADMDAAVHTQDSAREALRSVDPDAHLVWLFQRDKQLQWGGQLRQYIATLGLAPNNALPPARQSCPALKLFASSKSGADFLARVRQDWPEETLGEPLFYSSQHRRIMFNWEVEHLGEQQFVQLQSEATETLARQEQDEVQRKQREQEAAFTIPQWQVELQVADSQLLAQQRLLQGFLVAKVSDGAPIQLQAGDILVAYDSVYDIVMSNFGHFGARAKLTGLAKYGGKLRVLRNGQWIELDVPGE